jgi:predicted DNA-binding transcriptional regulator
MTSNREEKEEISGFLNALYHQNLHKLLDKGVMLEPPIREVIDGEYPIGVISYAGKKLYDFCLREEDFPRHVCISGMSGSGKTTLAFNIIQDFIKKDKPFLVFDWKKSFRPLIKADARIMTFTVGNSEVANHFRLNINEPPIGVSPKEWINVLCDLLTESFFVSFGVHKVLLETLDESFKEWGVYSGSKNYPTWNHIKWRLEERLEKTKGREAGWIESALRIATVMTFGSFGEVVNYKGEKKVSISNLLDEKVILELNSLGNIEKKFFCEFLLTYIYKMKKSRQNSSVNKFDHAIVVDEAHNIFLKEKTHFVKESVTDMIYREMREYGTSLICLDQHLSKISDTVKGNSACHIAFQQQLPQDIYDVSELMQLREQKQVFSQLPVGSAIVKLSERYTLPFLIEAPFVNLRSESVSDEDIKWRMKCLFDAKSVEAGEDVEFKKALITPPANKGLQITEATPGKILVKIEEMVAQGKELNEIEKELSSSYNEAELMRFINLAFDKQFKKRAVQTQETVSILEDSCDNEEKFVNFLKSNPQHKNSIVEIYKLLGLSARKGTALKRSLLERGKIKVEVQKYEKGWKKFIRLS